MSFSPNIINKGGEHILENLRINHYSALFNVKPVVNSRIPPKKSGARPKKQESPFLETLVAMKKVENAKSNTDHSKPETIQMSQKLSEYKKRKKKTQFDSHATNLQIMQKRIDRYSNPVEQKKNEFNYKENPVILFRQQSDDKHVKTVIKSKKEGDIYAIIQKKSKAKKQPQDQVNLKELLLTEIIENQIWTNEDLEALFERTREAYPSNKDLESAINYVRSEVLS